MMNKILYVVFCIHSMVFSLELSRDMPLQIEGTNTYKIFVEEDTTAFANLEISLENEPGEYTVELGSVSGVFSSGWNEIGYDITKTPLLDVQKKSYPMKVGERDIAKVMQLVFTLPSQVVLPPGTYTAEMPVKIVKGEKVVKEKVVTAYFSVDEQVTAKLLMNGVEVEGERNLIQFGNIYGNMEKEFSFSVKSNTDVQVTISSKNNGKMILDDGSGDQTCYIPYTIERQGEEVTLDHESTFIPHKFAQNMNELLSNVKVLLQPDMEKTFCGKYRDRINITVSSL